MNFPPLNLSTTLKATFIAFTGSLLIACTGSQSRMTNLNLGMSKAQVIEVMGQPDSAAAQDGQEYLIYTLNRGVGGARAGGCAATALFTLGAAYTNDRCSGVEDDYFVRFVSGELESYGRVGDFDSTQVPEATINVNTNE